MLKNEVLLNKTKELMQEYQALTGCDASAISVQDFATLRNQALEEIKYGYTGQTVNTEKIVGSVNTVNTVAIKPNTSVPTVTKEEPKSTQKQAKEETKNNISYINHGDYTLADEEPIVTKKNKAAFLSRMKG